MWWNLWVFWTHSVRLTVLSTVFKISRNYIYSQYYVFQIKLYTKLYGTFQEERIRVERLHFLDKSLNVIQVKQKYKFLFQIISKLFKERIPYSGRFCKKHPTKITTNVTTNDRRGRNLWNSSNLCNVSSQRWVSSCLQIHTLNFSQLHCL